MSHPLKTQKTALITGASSGIGLALARHFAQDGYHLVLAARSVAKMQALADRLHSQFQVDVTVIGADLETNGGAAQLHADIKSRNIVLSALVNNAGYGAFGEFKDSALPQELAMMQLNMNTVVVLTKLFMPELLATASGFQDKADLGNSALVKGKKLPTSEEVAALGYRAMQRGQRVYIPGFMNWVMAQSIRFTPRNMVTRLVKTISRPIA